MSDLTFSQAERRSYLVPGLIALVVLAIICGYLYWHTPKRVADLTVTHTAILPEHTVFKTGSTVVGAQEVAQDDLYVLATIRVDNHLRLPLVINDITATLTAPDDSVTDASAIEKTDLPNLYTTFPAIVPLATSPLSRETSIPPGDHAEGMVILHFPVSQAEWKQSKSASVTITFYSQGSATVTIPK